MSLSFNKVSRAIDEAVSYAVSKGVTVVCSAGNETSNTKYFSPAHLSSCIVVAASDNRNSRAWFSNYGNSVDVIAPGVNIKSSIPGGRYETMSGTSMSAPHISALAAMIKLLYPSYSPADIEKMIKNNTKDLGTRGYDIYYEYGIPDMQKLLDKIAIKPSVSISAGSTGYSSVQLSAKTVPVGRAVTWRSSNTGVVTVNNGVLTAKGNGIAYVTATMEYNGKYYTSTKTIKVESNHSYGAWSNWSIDPVYANESREVRTTALYRYYCFLCPVCGGREPLQGMSDCHQYRLTLANGVAEWFTTPYSQCISSTYSYAKYKRYTTSLGDGKRWNFSSGNLYHTAIGTKDTDSAATVIQTGYSWRNIYKKNIITSVQ